MDDELPARECLHNYLRDYCRDLEVVAQADSSRMAYNAILKHQPDLLFLDVEMPNGSGFDLLRKFNRITFGVIFITAYEEYAVQAFRFCATDFLLKPINIKELIEAVDKFREEKNRKIDHLNIETLLRMNQGKAEKHNVLVIPNNEGFRVLNIGDIITCQADGYCTIFYLRNHAKLVSSRNLKHYDDILSSGGFQRVHNSYLINLDYVTEYSSEGVISLVDNIQAPLGNTFKKKFLEHFEGKK